MSVWLRLLLLVLLLAPTAIGCAPSPESEWLRSAERAHAAGDRQALEAFLAEPVPAGVQGDDARVVRQDAGYALARLAIAEGDAAGAEALASELLEGGAADDLFTANLYVVRGQALEILGQPVRATMDYHDALVINETLLEAALNEGESER